MSARETEGGERENFQGEGKERKMERETMTWNHNAGGSNDLTAARFYLMTV